MNTTKGAVMRNTVQDNKWSPFDPEWYHDAFDKHTSVDEELFNKDEIIRAGYVVPDSDGSKSSVFRQEASMNNSFNEEALRETLKQIYLNNTHRLAASNHDNVHFFKWNGTFDDVTFTHNTELCEIVLPTDSFLSPSERNRFKLSQYYHTWVKITDIYKNWDVYHSTVLLFINRRIYSEYELWIDEQQTKIRFKYFSQWVKNNYPIYVVRFDTVCQYRIGITKELVVNQWNWSMPIDYITDKRLATMDKAVIVFNRIADKELRSNNLDVDALGDNLEFVKIENGFIDLSKISDFNKTLVQSDGKEWLWLSIFVPKFFHEYPILLPVDLIYRRYQSNFARVMVSYEGEHKGVNAAREIYQEPSKVFVDLAESNDDTNGTWKQIIRPIVFTDAFLDEPNTPYSNIMPYINNIQELTIEASDIIEQFRSYMDNYQTDEEFIHYCDLLQSKMNELYNAYNNFCISRNMDTDLEYKALYESFLVIMDSVREDKDASPWFKKSRKNKNTLWGFISPLINIPRELTDRYYINVMLDHIGDGVLWEDKSQYVDKRRFNFPIDVSDFWTFEYDMEKNVWRPCVLEVEHHFPDVYTLNTPDSSVPEENHVYKAFFFYTDDMNILTPATDFVEPTNSWDVDVNAFMIHGAIYRDIFIEKFYWMAIKAVYKGILNTKYRWEVIEYLIDNPSYERFNQLFLHTMDPYFKMGLANYLHSDDNEFPFDYDVDKMTEAIKTKFLNYQRITNYEMYLSNTWMESYFDFVISVFDDWNGNDRLLRRPRPSFDIERVLSIIKEITNHSKSKIQFLLDTIDTALEEMGDETFNIDMTLILSLKKLSISIEEITDEIISKIENLDMNIYSIGDINDTIEMLNDYKGYISQIDSYFETIHANLDANSKYDQKLVNINEIHTFIAGDIVSCVNSIAESVRSFDINEFMRILNDPRYFDNVNGPANTSLIGLINSFSSPWSETVQHSRDDVFKSSLELYNEYHTLTRYTQSELDDLYEEALSLSSYMNELQSNVHLFWDNKTIPYDDAIETKMNYVINQLEILVDNLQIFIQSQLLLQNACDDLNDMLLSMEQYNISDTEENFIININENMLQVIEYCQYLDGSHINDAIRTVNNVLAGDIQSWIDFINSEKFVFESLKSVTVIDEEMESITVNDIKIINAVIAYMDTVNNDFIPDSKWPTYCDIYTIGDIEIVSAGFNNTVGDLIFINGVGIYKVTEIDDEIGAVRSLELTDLRNTLFRDPGVQSLNPYDSISNGNGVGVAIKVRSSNRSPIINDEPTLSYIEKINKILELIRLNKDMINPYTNVAVDDDISRIQKIDSNWVDLKDKYLEYMSEYAVTQMNALISAFDDLIPPLTTLNEARSVNDFGNYISRYNDFITLSYTVFEEAHLINPNYLYFNNRMKEAYARAAEFYGNGTKWNDAEEEKVRLNDILYEIELFNRKMMNMVESQELLDEYNWLVDYVNNIDNTLNTIYDASANLDSYIEVVSSLCETITPETITHEKWYNIANIMIGVEGQGYRVGDILRIIPQLPVDIHGEPIHDQEELIMNDNLYVQITQVGENGQVINLDLLMQYALPYEINGSRKMESIFGTGSGLIVNFNTLENTLKNSTLFLDEDSDQKHLPQYAPNDLFMFKFENTHELDIQYEVFLGGKQINDFIFRKETDGVSNVKSTDVIYLNANRVMELKDNSIYKEGENYFVYKITDIKIDDPGAGYTLGQVIVVNTEQVPLKLKVTKLDGTPYNGIVEVEIDDSNAPFNGVDPVGVNVPAVMSSVNNIDDEYNSGYYDSIPAEGIVKPATLSYPVEEYPFTSRRFDDLPGGNRNQTWMYPEIDSDKKVGDPEEGWCLGKRAGDGHFYDGINPAIAPTDGIIEYSKMTPPGIDNKSEFQSIQQLLIHNSESPRYNADFVVATYDKLPRKTNEWPAAAPGKIVVVESDETNNGHRMAYMLRTFTVTGYFIYEKPEYCDYIWNVFKINWNDIDCYQDMPTLKAQYPSDKWRIYPSYKAILNDIEEGHIERQYTPVVRNRSYISNLTIDDLSVFNHTTNEWEDLTSPAWSLNVINDDINQNWGFELAYNVNGFYKYDMELFLNKTKIDQTRTSETKRNARFTISTDIKSEVDSNTTNKSINTGRQLRIRKLFPYEQSESFIVNNDNKEMHFIMNDYDQFKNEIHAEDIMLFNKTANRYEPLLDSSVYELRFKDDKATQQGMETQKIFKNVTIAYSGTGFSNGYVWGYNKDNDAHIFGRVTASMITDGGIITFTPLHCSKYPEDNSMWEFVIYQFSTQNISDAARVIIEFRTEKIDVYGDGWIHDVKNPMSPVPKEFKIICKYDFEYDMEYEVTISKVSKTFVFVRDSWEVFPTFHLDNYWVPEDRIYIVTDKGRFPLINPSTGKPSMLINYTESGTDVKFLNVYNKYDHFEVHTTIYPMRSVYTQRRLPENGYLDLAGKINKPLNKKYFEFWINGRLLDDEVTIISPTKVFFHGLKSLRNLEIIEINRDYNEYFSDVFLGIETPQYSRPYPVWNMTTYLDDALSGTLEGENYTTSEQEYLLAPVWHQVPIDDPEYKNYPPNQDTEEDILLRVDSYVEVTESGMMPYQFAVINVPTIEGAQITGRTLEFGNFGFTPITNSDIMDYINEEWAEEIANGEIDMYTLVTNTNWYGYGTKLYDEYGVLVHNLNDAAYVVADDNIIVIDTSNNISSVITNKTKYDLD